MNMKKIFLALLVMPFLLGCQNNQQNSSAPAEQYIQVNVEDLSLMEDETYQIQTKIIRTGTIVFYSSADENVATVSESGLITAIKQGETTITVRGGKDTYSIFLEVTPYQAHDSLQIVMEKDSFILAVNDEYLLPIEVRLGNEIINNAELTFAFETENIVSIHNLTITALNVGTTKCLVTASYQQEEVSKGFNITVY